MIAIGTTCDSIFLVWGVSRNQFWEGFCWLPKSTVHGATLTKLAKPQNFLEVGFGCEFSQFHRDQVIDVPDTMTNLLCAGHHNSQFGIILGDLLQKVFSCPKP